MGTTEEKNQSEKNEQSEEKIVNLFEDMNPHKHNEESYQKMIQEQEANKKQNVNVKVAQQSGNFSDESTWKK